MMIVLIIGLLAVPAITGVLRDNARDIQELERRKKSPSPPIGLLFNDARQFVRTTDAFLKDSIGFRSQANAAYRKTRYFVFKDAPLPNLTIGRDGYVFLNVPLSSSFSPNLFFDTLCIRQGEPSTELLESLDGTFAAASGYFTRRGARTTIAVVPTKHTVYADKLPLTVPSAYRKACLDYPQKDHALARLARRGATDGRYRVFYPHELFVAHRDEPYFYPKERYHCMGRSVYLFARHLLQESGAVEGIAMDDPATLTEVSHDIAGFFGYALPVKAWSYSYAGRTTERRTVPWFLEAFGGRPDLLNHFATENSLTPKTALMIGNSFGTELSDHLSKGFQNLYFLNWNNFSKGQDQAAIFAAVAERVKPDFVYFIVDAPNVTRLPEWLAAFIELERRESPSPQNNMSAPDALQQP